MCNKTGLFRHVKEVFESPTSRVLCSTDEQMIYGVKLAAQALEIETLSE